MQNILTYIVKANCRFFYTPAMILDQSKVWEQTYALRWGSNETCVPGSSGQPSSQTGISTSYIDSPPPECARNFFGADVSWFVTQCCDQAQDGLTGSRSYPSAVPYNSSGYGSPPTNEPTCLTECTSRTPAHTSGNTSGGTALSVTAGIVWVVAVAVASLSVWKI